MNSLSPEQEKSAVITEASVGSIYPLKLLIVPGVVILGLLMLTVLNSQDFVNYDCAYYFLCAKLLLQGKQPFVDFVDLLPPIIFYISVPPVWLSQVLNVPIATVWSMAVWCTVALSFLACVFVLRAAKDISSRDWLAIAPLVCGFLLFNLILGFHFGQREHFFILTYFPIFLIRWLRWTQPGGYKPNQMLAIICGSACALAVFVKPQFLIIVLLLELYFSQTPQQNKPWHVLKAAEFISMLATLCVCLAVSSFIPNVQTYYSRWVPFVSQGYAAFFAPNPFFMLLFAAPDGQMMGNTILAGVVCIVAFFLSGRSVLLGSLFVWTVAGALLYVLQGRGWSYQSIPAICGYFLLCTGMLVMVAERLISGIAKMRSSLQCLSPRMWCPDPSVDTPTSESNEIKSRIATVIFLAYALLLMPISTFLVHNSAATATTFKTLDGTIARQTEPRDKVVILHTLIPNAHQAQLLLDRDPGCRYIWCFPLRMTDYLKKTYSTREKGLTEEPRIVSEIIEDIRKSKPKLIAIEAFSPDGAKWTLLDTLAGYHFFARALSNYEPIGGCNKFAVWKLKTNMTPDLATSEASKSSGTRIDNHE